MTVAVVIPTYNESKNIEKLISRIFSLNLPVKVLIVDDNSPDGTGMIVERLKKLHPHTLFILHRSGKLGLGSAYRDGFSWALNHMKTEFIVSMDADLTHDPACISSFIDEINRGYDVVVGSRYLPGGGMHRSKQRELMSRCANHFVNLILGLNVTDTTNSLRCYRSNIIAKALTNKPISSGYSFLQEILFYCKKSGASITEIPVFLRDREKGTSKMSKKEIIHFFTTLARLKWQDLTTSIAK